MGKRNCDNEIQYETPTKRAKVESDYGAEECLTPQQQYYLTKEIVDGTVLVDLNLQKWRVGAPVGKGSFGEIFLASDNINKPVTEQNAKFVVKIEPHSNGPLFVEIHCLLNAGKSTEEKPLPDGMPEYIASGSHFFKDDKYRFLVLPRFKYDLHSIVKVQKKLDQKNVLVIACQILDILQHLHDNGYVHSDIKAENLMIGSTERPKLKSLSHSNFSSAYVSSASSSTTTTTAPLDDFKKNNNKKSPNNNHHHSIKEEKKEKLSQATKNNSNLIAGKCQVEFSGSNPIRSCRFSKLGLKDSGLNYDEMVTSHYLRPLKHINYNVDDTDDESMRNGIFGKRRPPPKEEEDEIYNSNSNISCYSDKSATTNSVRSFSSSGISSIMNNRTTRNNRNRMDSGGSNDNLLEDEDEEDRNEDEEEDEEEAEEKKRDRIYLIDFGLASKFVDSNGAHRPFFMDERRAHDGTLEFTSRDAHLGAHARRSDLECLGFNIIYWLQGELPWKNEKLMQQPDEVHHMKEFFMSNVKEMLKLCYGQTVPKYLGIYMDYVNKLMYNDRPDYDYCRSIFRNEFTRLGYSLNDMHIDFEYLKARTPIKKAAPKSRRNGIVKREQEDQIDGETPHKNGLTKVKGAPPAGNNDLLVKFGLMVPSIKENQSNKISPKNLRSKKNSPKKKRKKMSWEELLATDPEQIARERIEKEYDEQDSNLEVSIKYSGNPTYAIMELENKLNGTLNASSLGEPTTAEDSFLEVGQIKGYTKPMMDIVRKRHSNLMRTLIENKTEDLEKSISSAGNESLNTPPTARRRKSGLRPQVKNTPKSLFYHKNLLKQKLMERQRREAKLLASKAATALDESSTDSSSVMVVVNHRATNGRKKKPVLVLDTDEEATNSGGNDDDEEQEEDEEEEEEETNEEEEEDDEDEEEQESEHEEVRVKRSDKSEHSCDKAADKRATVQMQEMKKTRGRPRKVPAFTQPTTAITSKRIGKQNDKTKSMRTLTRG